MRPYHRNINRFPAALLLVWLCCLLLAGCERRETAPPAEQAETATAYAGTIIAAGDSLTAGQGVAPQDAWPSLLAKKLAKNGLNWQVINAGISGETSSGMVARSKWLLAQRPEIVIVATGANDGLRGIPPQVIRENIAQTVRLLQSGQTTVVLAGMQIVQNLGEDYSREFAAIYPAVAGELQCILIPFLLKEVAGEPSLNQEDTIHPNEKGHQVIAEIVYPYVLQAIQAHPRTVP
ncbi:MAG TPA: arylesterase [Desulfobulbaceae bacterium]|nr:arylesterase [Desulfobulbaceae bacterium]